MSFNFYEMKNVNFIFLLCTFILLSSLTSCQKEPELATVITSPVQNIAYNSAVSGGYISDDGGADVTARGVVWNTSPNPTTANNSTNDGDGTGSFTSNLTGLTANTTYYVRAYATNSLGTAYGDQQSFNATGIIASNPGAGVTYNGYSYSSVVLGNGQEWMAENLRTANYRNGDPITTGLDNAAWNTSTTGAYVIYYNDNATAIYGKLYNWYAVSDPRQLCPTGWHEPSDAEWTMLTDYLGGESVAGGKMKTTEYWISPNLDATNESGFSGLPGGRNEGVGIGIVTGYGSWWSSSESSTTNAWCLTLSYLNGTADRDDFYKGIGLSVRCLKE